ncbi:MAG: hypothetical protein Q8R53_02145 [Nanoarchaeota archaeon]|nr:hypothetical protein [Nanoarchaeota archaeon]
MDLKKWFLSKRFWLRGGIIGVIVCIVLFLFYIFVYSSSINKIYAEDIAAYGGTPAWTTTVPLVTGHFFPLFSGFIIPYGFLCEFAVPICTNWSAAYEPGAVPWIMEGQAGYCIEQTMTPTDSCANLSEAVGFFGLAILLIGIYFGIGAAIGGFIQRRIAK